jgi:hypothetical protein
MTWVANLLLFGLSVRGASEGYACVYRSNRIAAGLSDVVLVLTSFI